MKHIVLSTCYACPNFIRQTEWCTQLGCPVNPDEIPKICPLSDLVIIGDTISDEQFAEELERRWDKITEQLKPKTLFGGNVMKLFDSDQIMLDTIKSELLKPTKP